MPDLRLTPERRMQIERAIAMGSSIYPDHIKVTLSKGKWHFVCTRCGGNMLVESSPAEVREQLRLTFTRLHEECAQGCGEDDDDD